MHKFKEDKIFFLACQKQKTWLFTSNYSHMCNIISANIFQKLFYFLYSKMKADEKSDGRFLARITNMVEK